MSWFVEDRRSWSQKLFANILKAGPLPKHVALIMDGNRRYARTHNIEKIEGHKSGFEKLIEALSWCFTIDIKEVTVYAFSIENFKRSEDEVNGLFDLAREKFQKLLDEREKIEKLQICIRVFGQISLLPQDLQKILAKVIDMSKNHTKLFLNVCIAYTSRDEMTLAVKNICKGVEENKLETSDITEELIDKCLYTGESNELDLLVRTSGEVRLSDFVLWQSSFSVLSFVKQMWPDFSIWNFYFGILDFQLSHKKIQEMKSSIENNKKIMHENIPSSILKHQKNRQTNFLTELRIAQSHQLELLATT